MHRLVQRQNIAKLSNLIAVELDPGKRSTLMKSLTDQEDQFGFGLEQLTVAEKHLADCHHHTAVLRGLINYLDENGHGTSRENDMLQALLELEAKFRGYRQSILDRVSGPPLPI
jgi:hypothetical protein